MGVVTISSATLNQFALDFEGNFKRILKSIEIARQDGARLRTGPELEICGYSCEDHFYESDTRDHSWEVLAALMAHPLCQDIAIDVGMPIMHHGVTYNCRVLFLNRKILLIRPKMILCDDGNYRETRWFTAWTKKRYVEDHPLPAVIMEVGAQKTAPFGDALVQFSDACMGFEICEELWNPNSTSIQQTLAGAEIILNSSGSHTEIRKAYYALELIKTASSKCGCLYIFSNLRGCDGERLYMNGCSTFALNGQFLKLSDQYSLRDVEVLTANVEIEEIRSYKNSIRSRTLIAASVESYPREVVDWSLESSSMMAVLSPPLSPADMALIPPEEEIARGPALWLWDYLRRSAASGFFLPLSGGVDSSSVAIIVYSMASLITTFISDKDNNETSDNKQQVLADVRKVVRDPSYIPKDAKDLCSRILRTCYMGSVNSSEETRQRAKSLADAIGSRHTEINISGVCDAFVEETAKSLQKEKPSFGGTRSENLALQNVQARSRMVFAYLFAQLGPWAQNGQDGFLLVLGTANVDEAIRGYFTKYDCSAADLNPIGGISKTDLKAFIIHAGKKFGLAEVAGIVEAPPTAELKPLSSNQTDEEDMGMTYEELSFYGKLRKPLACGPFSMFTRLLSLWAHKHDPSTIASKVKHFYVSYAVSRHKMSVLTPAVHMESYGPEDHRYDLRPILYPVDFTWQFRKIDQFLKRIL